MMEKKHVPLSILVELSNLYISDVEDIHTLTLNDEGCIDVEDVMNSLNLIITARVVCIHRLDSFHKISN